MWISTLNIAKIFDTELKRETVQIKKRSKLNSNYCWTISDFCREIEIILGEHEYLLKGTVLSNVHHGCRIGVSFFSQFFNS